VQAAIKVWRYGNQQHYVPHVDNNLESVMVTAVMFLNDSGQTRALLHTLLLSVWRHVSALAA
jgi:hypothetical protein